VLGAWVVCQLEDRSGCFGSWCRKRSGCCVLCVCACLGVRLLGAAWLTGLGGARVGGEERRVQPKGVVRFEMA
jgi:hypothetical protein